ncbi:Os04g0661400 [Oryza sativa Japonica Group]|uniref:Os04g0661400 protein n=1 Tax=Oryza sativa subsp. japonica TaxID=39947 RepID=A0A0N7KJV3_ORYSJ|nr:Os04g0661400 [Oryza sativa Japonica Group]
MEVQCSPMFLFPISMLALPAGALVGVPGATFVAMVAPGGGACAMTTTARRMVLAAAPSVALHQGGGGGPAGACLRRGIVCFKAGDTPSSGDDEAKAKVDGSGLKPVRR